MKFADIIPGVNPKANCFQATIRDTAKEEFLSLHEYIINRFCKGLSCEFGNSNNKLFRVFIDKDGATQVALDKKMRTEKKNEALIGVLIKSLSEAFETNYLKAMKIIPENDFIEKETNLNEKK